MSETELVNHALRKCGGRRILNITEDAANAGIAQDVLNQERDDLLRSHNWNCAITRAKLARLSTEPPFEFAYAYSKPADCMRIVSVHASSSGQDAIRYKAESISQDSGVSYIPVILCDAEEVWLRYVRRVTDTNLMDASFRQCLILRLAIVFATANANSNSLHETLTTEFERAIRRARSTDGIEDYPEQFPDPSWVTARSGWMR